MATVSRVRSTLRGFGLRTSYAFTSSGSDRGRFSRHIPNRACPGMHTCPHARAVSAVILVYPSQHNTTINPSLRAQALCLTWRR